MTSTGPAQPRTTWTLDSVVVRIVAPLVLLTSVWFAIPGNPFEADAGPLDRLLPASIDCAVRGEGVALAEHPLVQAFGLTPAAVDDALAEPAARAPAGYDVDRIESDFLGREFVLALRDDEPLLLLRCTARVRELDLAYDMPQDELDTYHATVESDLIRVDREDGLSLYTARHRDILLVSPDDELLRAALACGDEGTGSLARRLDYANALGTDTPPAGRLTAWVDPEFLDDFLYEVAREGPVAWLREVLLPDDLGPAAIHVELLPDRVRLSLYAAWEPDSQSVDADRFLDGREGEPGAAAPALTPDDGSTFLTAALALRPEVMLTRAVSEMPSEEADPAALDDAVRRVAAQLQSGARIVLTRLPEAGRLDVESRERLTPHSLAGVLLEFRPRSPRSSDVLAGELARLWQAIAGPDAALVTDGPVLHPTAWPWDDRWHLLRPAAALHGQTLLLASNEALLRRVLHAAPRDASAPPPTSSTVAAARIDVPGLHAHLVDQRGRTARGVLHQDLSALQPLLTRRVRVRHRRAALPADTLERAVADELDAYRSRLDTVDFPAALDHERSRWDLLDRLATGDVRVHLTENQLLIEAEVLLR